MAQSLNGKQLKKALAGMNLQEIILSLTITLENKKQIDRRKGIKIDAY